ncbi:MAG: lipocalin family protein [Bacteroidota bacterium]
MKGLNFKNLALLSVMGVFALVGCKKNDPAELIPHITGYWQIEKVILSNGTAKKYGFSETIDYLEVEDSLVGFRKKLKPRLNGTYITSNNLERFKLTIENDSLHIYYSTPFDNWKETILNANENQLLIINQNRDIYSYVPYEPLKIEE